MNKRFSIYLINFILICLMCVQTGAKAKTVTTKKITLNFSSLTMTAGSKVNLRITSKTPKNSTSKVTYKSSDKKVLTVSGKGVLSAKKKGTATITVKCGKAVKRLKISVSAKLKTKKKILVAYFSATGTTKAVAEKIAKACNADLYKITPAKAYSQKDLDYNNDNCRANKEQNNKNSRPALKGKAIDASKYSAIIIGHPIWWGIEPRIMDTFMESYSFKGKTLVNFCTSGGSGISQATANLKAKAKNAKWLEGKRFDSNADYSQVQNWIDSLGIKK